MIPARIVFLPLVAGLELIALGSCFIIGFFNPSLGLRLVERCKKKFPDIDYWTKCDKRNKLNNALFLRKNK